MVHTNRDPRLLDKEVTKRGLALSHLGFPLGLPRKDA
jgi:hypothetical protein